MAHDNSYLYGTLSLTEVYRSYVCRFRILGNDKDRQDQAGQWLPLHFAKEMEQRALYIATGDADSLVGTVDYEMRADALLSSEETLPILPLENLMER